MPISYFNPFRTENGYVFSCDNIRISFTVSELDSSSFSWFFNSLSRCDIQTFPLDTRDTHFRYMWTIDYGESKMAIGFMFNGYNVKEDNLKGYLDFNPNKVGNNEQFWVDYKELIRFFKHYEIVRCDIALDIPVKREYLILEKSNQKYSVDAYSFSNRTEYLGKRNNLGYVKVYNKSKELKDTKNCDLDADWTRIEVTCLPNIVDYELHFPKVYDISQSHQLDFSLNQLNDTDFAILSMELKLLSLGADDGLMLFKSLGRKKVEKLKPFLLPESSLVSLFCYRTTVSALFDSVRSTYL